MEKLHIQPSEIDRLPFFEVQFMIEDLHDRMKEEAKENERQSAEYQKSAPQYKAPKAPKVSMPTMRMPRY